MADEPRVSDAIAPTPLADEVKPPVAEPEKKEPDAATDAGKTPPASKEDDDEDLDDDKPGEAAEQAGTGEDKPKQQRPGKYRRQIMRQEAQIEALTSTVRELTTALARPTAVDAQPKGDAKTEGLAPPKEGDFENPDDYLKAVARWEARQELAKILKDQDDKRLANERKAAEDSKVSTVKEKIAKGREHYADFEEVALSEDVPLSQAMADAMADSDHFHHIAYYLGSHPDEAYRIARLGPAAAAREIGRIEGKFLNPPKSKPTSAPAPVTTVKPGNDPVKDPRKMSPSEYRKWRESGGGVTG